jgi:uncharacterized protein (DUF362 family)
MPMSFRLKQIVKLKKSCETLTYKKFIIKRPALVGKAKTITKAIELINGLEEVRPGDSVLIKPNINSDDVYPGTTRPAGLRELIKLLKKKKAKITVGDMSSAFWSHTRVCAETVGIQKVCDEEKVLLKYFDDGEWIEMQLPGTGLKDAWFTSELCSHMHLINLCVLKTHRLADFTMSLKNLMGCLHLRTRMRMHAKLLRQRIGEFNKAITPVLNIVDGTKCFIDGGPDKGELRSPGVVLASKDRVALDVTGINILKDFGSKSLKDLNPWDHPQIKSAVRNGVGISKNSDIKVVTKSTYS